VEISKEIEAGQAIYSKPVLSIYDLWVLGISNKYIWKCPTSHLLKHFNQHITSNHLDVGVGTGYFLDHCQFPTGKTRIGLLDLNQNSLDQAAKRIERYQPTQYQYNVLDKLDRSYWIIWITYCQKAARYSARRYCRKILKKAASQCA